jgi:hypothetical protein
MQRVVIASFSGMLALSCPAHVAHAQSASDYQRAVRDATEEYRGDVPSPDRRLSANRDEDLRADKAAKIAAFQEFFSGHRDITDQEVITRFGRPDRHGLLYLNQKEEPPSWWYYRLDADEYIGVAIEDGKAGMVVYFRSDHTSQIIRSKKA